MKLLFLYFPVFIKFYIFIFIKILVSIFHLIHILFYFLFLDLVTVLTLIYHIYQINIFQWKLNTFFLIVVKQRNIFLIGKYFYIIMVIIT